MIPFDAWGDWRTTMCAKRFVAVVIASLTASVAYAADPAAPAASPPAAPIAATFTVRGMHCPPCASVLAGSLKRTKGIRSAKVDWKTRQARIEFDEGTISLGAVARAMAATPHMMGGNMQYGGAFVLNAPMLKDEASAQAVTEALAKVPGVVKVTPWIKQHSVTIRFAEKEDVTVQQLQDALTSAAPVADQAP
jgi:copper chaperone CopZ